MRFVVVLIIILLFVTGFIIFNFAEVILLNNGYDYPLSRGEELVNSTLGKGSKIIKNKYNLKPCGEGASMPGGPIQKLALCFDTKHPYSKEELRKLLIETAHELLNLVHENDEIQQFLKERPFTIKNIQIIIYNHNKMGLTVYDPGISNAEISLGFLSYQTIDPLDTFKYKNRFEETYEEALKAMGK